MDLKPQDVVVLLKLLVGGSRGWTYAKFGEELGMSASHVFAAINRAEAAHLAGPVLPPPPDYKPNGRSGLFLRPNRNNLKEFLIHGVKYAFPAELGGPTRGIPTAGAAPPLNHHFFAPPMLPPVWPYAEGSVRGTAFSPLYKSVPRAALRDLKLYELLALVDAIREGRARDREIAIKELTSRIDAP